MRRRLFSSVFSSRDFWLLWMVSFAALIGVVSGIAQLFSMVKLSATNAVILIFVSGLISGICALYRVPHTHLPVDDIIPLTLSSQPVLSLEVTTDRVLQVQADRLAINSYSGVSALLPERYEQFLMINPTILACLLDKNRRVVGYFDVFPLELSFFNLFVQGICSEQDIRREHILSAASARYTKKLYLGGFAVVDPHTMKGRRYASLGVWGLVKYLQHYYHIPRDLELFAEAASKDGEELLKRFGFRVVSHENQRRSHCSLYSVYLTENIVSMTLNSLPDWSNACDLVWV